MKAKHAPCLDAVWHNSWDSGHAKARSLCARYGRVVVKWDLRSAMDWTWHLNDSKPRGASAAVHIRHAYCCADLGICKPDDALSDRKCIEAFHRSKANEICKQAQAKVSKGLCSVRALCPKEAGGYTKVERTLRLSSVENLWLCGLGFRIGRCP